MIIVFMLIGIAAVAFGALLIVKVKSDIANEKIKKGSASERSEEVGTSFVSMGLVLLLASIVKIAGGISTVAFVVILILDILCLVALMYLINRKHAS